MLLARGLQFINVHCSLLSAANNWVESRVFDYMYMYENLLHDQSDLKAAMTLFPTGTQLADEESDSD